MHHLLLLFLTCAAVAAPPAWPDAILRLERQASGANVAQISTALCVAPGLLATILEHSAAGDTYRVPGTGGTTAVKLLARDADSGFALLAPVEKEAPAWQVIALGDPAPAPPAGTSLTLQSAAPAPARAAGRDVLHKGKLLQTPWLRIHLPAGTWNRGTPLTTADGAFAGLLAGSVPGVPEAARALPAGAVRHFVKLWTDRQTLARAELGLRLRHADGIPRVAECYAALPAERAGLHPGDVILRIADESVPDAAAVAAACFLLRADEPVKIEVLRGMEVVALNVTPVAVTPRSPGP